MFFDSELNRFRHVFDALPDFEPLSIDFETVLKRVRTTSRLLRSARRFRAHRNIGMNTNSSTALEWCRSSMARLGQEKQGPKPFPIVIVRDGTTATNRYDAVDICVQHTVEDEAAHISSAKDILC